MIRNRTILLIILSLAAPAANASPTDWLWSFGQGYFAYFGTESSSLDGYDADDARIGATQFYYYAVYHEQGVDGWMGDTGFYSRDLRAPIEPALGDSKTWTFYVWADPSYPQGSGSEHLEMMWGFGQPAPVFSTMEYVLTYVASAHGITGGTLPVGASVMLNQQTQGTWSFPMYRTTDGRTGYVFTLTAKVIPEPSSLLALFTGLSSAGATFARKRRR